MTNTPAKSTPAKAEDSKVEEKKTQSLTDLLAEKKAAKNDEVNKDDKVDAQASVGPEGDPNETSYVYPKDVKPPVDNTDKSVRWATPDEVSHMTAEQMAARHGYDNEISEEDLDNPRVQVYRDTIVNQVPSGTHLHPDIAKDLLNRGIAEQHTDNAQVKRTITDVYDFAPDAEQNDKF